MSSVKELLSLEGQVSVITGGATGIGFQMATGLAEAGSNIVLCSRKLEVCEESAGKLEKLGVKALAVRCDVTQPDQVESMKDAILQKFGRVDMLMNNAGRAWVAAPEDTPLDRWQQVLDLNVTPLNEKLFERNRENLEAEVPLHRTGGPDDLKGAAVLLASRASDFITGVILPVDGGTVAW